MGFFDFVKSLVGIGGCSMALELDAERVPVGGILSGRAILTGADKDYPVTSIKVKLLYVHVEAQEDSPLPQIDTRVMIDNTIANDEQIEAGGTLERSFTVQIPGGTEPSAHNVSYQVLVTADIPGLKDPSAKAELEVIEPEEGASMDLGGLYAKWPALQGTAEQPLVQAIRDLGYDHSEYDEERNYAIAEPLLAKFMRHESSRVREVALEAWSRVIGDEATPENVAALQGYLSSVDQDDDEILEVIEAAARFGRAGGLALLEPLLDHSRSKVREKIAWSIGLYADDVGKGLILLQKMVDDPDIHVRAQVIDAMSNFDGNGVVMQQLSDLAQDRQTPLPIRRKLPFALRRSWKFESVVWPGLVALASDEDTEVRERVADVMSSYTEAEGAPQLVEALLADPEAGVRAKMAYEICNFPEDKVGGFQVLLEGLASDDDDGRVRTSALSSLAKGRPVDEVVAYYRGWMERDPSEDVLRGIVHGIKFEEEPEYKLLLSELSNCPFPSVAREARDGFEFQR